MKKDQMCHHLIRGIVGSGLGSEGGGDGLFFLGDEGGGGIFF